MNPRKFSLRKHSRRLLGQRLWRLAMRAGQKFLLLKDSPTAAIGFSLVLFWWFLGLAAPWVSPFEPNETLLPMATPGTEFTDGRTFWMGTDHLGRDILSRVIWGARNTFIYAPIATFTAYIVGMAAGVTAGYYGGIVDEILSRLGDFVLSFPVLVLYVLIISLYGASKINLVLAVVFASSPGVMRIVRSLTLELRAKEYLAAAKLRGESDFYIMLVEILPNVRHALVVDFCLRMGYVIITIGVLGFLGLGLPPPDPDWGGMINETRALSMSFPHMAIFPCLAISSLVLGLNMVADGLREISLKR